MAADKKRGAQTVRDMVLSLVAISLAAGVIYLFIPHDEDQDPVRVVSYQVELNTARRAAPYPVAAPEGLSDKWRATSVTYKADGGDGGEGGTTADGGSAVAWHLGFVSPDQEYVAVEQSDGRAKPFVKKVTQGARDTGKSVRIDGADWARYEGDKYDALVRGGDGATTVVTGTASLAKLKQMAAALKAEKTDPSAPPTTAPSSAAPSSAASA